MYSMVLMMAMSGGGDVVAWQSTTGAKGHVAMEQAQQMNRCHGCHGCHGCYGGCYCGGYGGGYCHGCYGGGYGGYCGGYYGGGYCCSYGGYCGGGYVGCYYGGCYYGGGMMPGGMAPVPGGPGAAPPPKGGEGGDKPPKTGEEVAAPATITVSLPAEAKLFVDDYATKSTSGTRTFVSPPLTPGKDYSYTLKAEIMKDGEKLTVTERVPVRAGQDSTVALDMARFTGSGVAAK